MIFNFEILVKRRSPSPVSRVWGEVVLVPNNPKTPATRGNPKGNRLSPAVCSRPL